MFKRAETKDKKNLIKNILEDSAQVFTFNRRKFLSGVGFYIKETSP
jgi:hypothetical protein